jgi:glucan phosphorylase
MRPISEFQGLVLQMRFFVANTAMSYPDVSCRSVVHHAEHTLATDRYNFDDGTAYQAVALSVRDHLVESLRDTKAHYVKEDPKRVYYLSLEFLMGRSLLNSLMNLDLQKPYKEALEEIGYDLEVTSLAIPKSRRHRTSMSVGHRS